MCIRCIEEIDGPCRGCGSVDVVHYLRQEMIGWDQWVWSVGKREKSNEELGKRDDDTRVARKKEIPMG